MLNAEVISKEDHGYVMSIGIDGVKAFLNNKNIPEDGIFFFFFFEKYLKN